MKQSYQLKRWSRNDIENRESVLPIEEERVKEQHNRVIRNFYISLSFLSLISTGMMLENTMTPMFPPSFHVFRTAMFVIKKEMAVRIGIVETWICVALASHRENKISLLHRRAVEMMNRVDCIVVVRHVHRSYVQNILSGPYRSEVTQPSGEEANFSKSFLLIRDVEWCLLRKVRLAWSVLIIILILFHFHMQWG